MYTKTKLNLIFNIQGIVKLMFLEICRAFSQIAKIRPQIFISAAPFELFGRNFCHLATLGRGRKGGGGGRGEGRWKNSHLAATCRKISTETHNLEILEKSLYYLYLSIAIGLDR